ncbi:MAG: hypothetical protein H6Q84_3416 [Deltaproteobacteria bacterium]|nr:hypothetical protein [Deltaproteobacteria bacterium]MBP2679053.1 hypothetical protein [Deltaproteobacteria bacterium]MBS1243862.1 hypothetical protein [Deltaproteobacteria bacterium]
MAGHNAGDVGIGRNRLQYLCPALSQYPVDSMEIFMKLFTVKVKRISKINETKYNLVISETSFVYGNNNQGGRR